MNSTVGMAARPQRFMGVRRSLVSIVGYALTLMSCAFASAQIGPLQTQVVVDRTYQAVVQLRAVVSDPSGSSVHVSFG